MLEVVVVQLIPVQALCQAVLVVQVVVVLVVMLTLEQLV
jgi:hypothetical protein